MKSPTKVTTYQSSTGHELSICEAHECKLWGEWPRDSYGSPYSEVTHGLHFGACDLCQREALARLEKAS